MWLGSFFLILSFPSRSSPSTPDDFPRAFLFPTYGFANFLSLIKANLHFDSLRLPRLPKNSSNQPHLEHTVRKCCSRPPPPGQLASFISFPTTVTSASHESDSQFRSELFGTTCERCNFTGITLAESSGARASTTKGQGRYIHGVPITSGRDNPQTTSHCGRYFQWTASSVLVVPFWNTKSHRFCIKHSFPSC